MPVFSIGLSQQELQGTIMLSFLMIIHQIIQEMLITFPKNLNTIVNTFLSDSNFFNMNMSTVHPNTVQYLNIFEYEYWIQIPQPPMLEGINSRYYAIILQNCLTLKPWWITFVKLFSDYCTTEIQYIQGKHCWHSKINLKLYMTLKQENPSTPFIVKSNKVSSVTYYMMKILGCLLACMDCKQRQVECHCF